MSINTRIYMSIECDPNWTGYLVHVRPGVQRFDGIHGDPELLGLHYARHSSAYACIMLVFVLVGSAAACLRSVVYYHVVSVSTVWCLG